MISPSAPNFVLIASFADSIIAFRGQLIRDLLSAGIRVHVAAPGFAQNESIRSELKAIGVVVHDISLDRTGTSPVDDFRLAWSLFLLMRRVRPIWILGYTVKPVVYGILAGWLARVPYRFALVTGLGYAFTGVRRGLIPRLIQRLYRMALTRANKVFFQNPDDRDLFVELGILPRGSRSVVVNGSGIDLTAFAVYPIAAAPPAFLMIGRLLGDKGVREYVQAAERVRELHPDARFGLVGWIDENPDAIAQCELDAWIASGTIDFHGKLMDVRPSIAACSVYVLPSYREGTPRTVLEAMAMGRPVITTSAPGCRETVVDGDNGFLVPVQSAEALAEAMLRFFEDPSLAKRMGSRSRQIAEQKYDVHKVNEVMLREMGISATPNAGVGAA